MKTLYIIVVMLLLIACSKESDPITPVSSSVASVTCQNSTWRYEVILGLPVSTGTFEIQYRNQYGNMITDTSITSTWIKDFTMQYPGTPTGHFNLTAIVSVGPLGIRNIFTTNVENTVMVTIYKNGTMVQTTGNPVSFCYGQNPVCNTTTVGSLGKSHACN